MNEIIEKMSELKKEYDGIIANMESLNKTWNNLNNRKIEIEGAYKTLHELKTSMESSGFTPKLEVITNDTSSESE